MLGDGSINDKGVFYCNSNLALINDFIKDCSEVFGNIKLGIERKEKKNCTLYIISLPAFCKKILNKLGLPIGSKVANNPHIPKFIFNLDKEKIAEFISQLIDDEGSISIPSRHLGIHLAIEAKHDKFNLLEDIRRLFSSLGIESAAYFEKEYASLKGLNRKLWKIEIHSFDQLEKLNNILNLRHKEKSKKLKQLLEMKKLAMYPKKKCTEIYLSKMRAVQREKGYFTSKDLLKEINRSLGHIQNVIHKYVSHGLIHKIQNVTSDGTKFYPAKYRVVK